MGAISSKLRSIQTARGPWVSFWCPGCNEAHAIAVGHADWTWDGDAITPTFSPSVLVTTGHFLPGHKPGMSCWCTYYAKHPEKEPGFTCGRCHSFVRAGIIEFLSDCTHALKGQNVPLPDWPADYHDGDTSAA